MPRFGPVVAERQSLACRGNVVPTGVFFGGLMAMVDEIREQQYKDNREGFTFDDLHARTRDHDPGSWQRLARAVTWPLFKVIWKMHHEGTETLPSSGAVIIAANHASFLDHFFIGHGIPRPVNYMAKSQLFTPVTRTALNVLGAFPVRRGTRDDDAFTTAEAVLRRGGVLVTYPQAGRARADILGGRPRPGVGRLALDSGVPIIPVAIVGSARVREWTRGHFPQVTVRYGTAIPGRYEPRATRERHQQLADLVMTQIRALYAAGGVAGTENATTPMQTRSPTGRD